MKINIASIRFLRYNTCINQYNQYNQYGNNMEFKPSHLKHFHPSIVPLYKEHIFYPDDHKQLTRFLGIVLEILIEKGDRFRPLESDEYSTLITEHDVSIEEMKFLNEANLVLQDALSVAKVSHNWAFALVEAVIKNNFKTTDSGYM